MSNQLCQAHASIIGSTVLNNDGNNKATVLITVSYFIFNVYFQLLAVAAALLETFIQHIILDTVKHYLTKSTTIYMATFM